ncbi:DUF4394 domain-containing protein [Mucilaginibacter myungsuensis]
MAGLLSVVVASFSSCQKEEFVYNENTVTKPSITFVALTSSSSTTPSALIRYNSNGVTVAAQAATSITGLQTGESIVAIDYRPSNKLLYGLGSTGRLYSLTNAAGAYATVLVGAITPALSGGGVAAFDFNPVADRLRIITTTGLNYRVNPADATAIVDGAINNVANAVVTGCAYTNSVSPAPTTTELFSLDVASQRLYKQDANAGTLTVVGSLGNTPMPVNTPGYSTAYITNINNARLAAVGGFDISTSGVGLAVFSPNNQPAIPVGGIVAAVAATPTAPAVAANPGSAVSAITNNPSTLFKIDLQTGKATDLGVIAIIGASNEAPAANIIGLAILP